MTSQIFQKERKPVHTQHHEWSYDGDTGPSLWCKKFPIAAGKKQSPINIQQNAAVFDNLLPSNSLFIWYDEACCEEVKNTGHSFQVFGKSTSSKVIGGPTKYTHKFAQFHMHWGTNNFIGSEHTIDDRYFPGELHFVNYNADKYQNINDAVKANDPDALMVLGVLVKIGKENPELDKILYLLPKIKLKDQSAKLTKRINIKNLFPSDTGNYYTYEGSLTTPPCTECVKWVVFKTPIEVSEDQINALRVLQTCSDANECCDSTRMDKNYRPVCPLNDRVVRKSFKN